MLAALQIRSSGMKMRCNWQPDLQHLASNLRRRTMILFGSHFSPFVRKVLVYAAEKGIELEVRNIGLGSPDPDFKAASPMGKMPAFQDGDFRISDSTAIITYLEAKNPSPALLPASPEDRARAVWYEEFADTVMSMVVFKCFFNRVVAPLFLKQEGNEALAVEGEAKDLPPLLDYLETVVPDAGGFLCGDSLSVADISVATMFINYDHAQCAVDKSAWPRTYAWVDSMLARPSFATWVARERKILGR
jgi:glutathione S-transferase